MEKLIDIISLFIFVVLCLSIFLVVRKIQPSSIRFKFLWFLGGAYVISLLFIVLFAWWSYSSDRWLMEYYGYDFSIESFDPYAKVAPKDVARVEQLDMSTGGIGWPMKAILIHNSQIWFILLAFTIYYLLRLKMNKMYPKSDTLV